MRPARKGPENREQVGEQDARLAGGASMRPARKGPENRAPRFRGGAGRGRRFNEAGPQGAGKPPGQRRAADRVAAASMRPARKGPENRGGCRCDWWNDEASMRPARKGPENR